MIKLIYLLVVITACKTKYDANSCNVLSMQRYKGVPNSKKLFEENCKDFEIKYTAGLCQAALVTLMKTNSLKETKKEFGAPIENCFSSADLKRFAQD